MRGHRHKNLFLTLGAWSLEILAAMVSILPRPMAESVARAGGFLFGWFSHQQSNLKNNLKILLKLSDAEANHIARKSLGNFGVTLLDFFLPHNITLDIPGRDKLEQVRQLQKGMLLLTFHMGHWELGARTLSEWGWPVTAVYQPYTNKQFKRVIEKRRAKGVRFLPVGKRAAQGVREALRRGEIVAMLGDLPFGESGIAVNLMGHRIIWPKGPVVLAVREQAPIVIAVVLRVGRGRYQGFIEDPILPREKNRHTVEQMVQEVADKFGKLLRQYPTQWVRFQPLEFVDKEKIRNPVSKSTI